MAYSEAQSFNSSPKPEDIFKFIFDVFINHIDVFCRCVRMVKLIVIGAEFLKSHLPAAFSFFRLPQGDAAKKRKKLRRQVGSPIVYLCPLILASAYRLSR